MSNLLLSTLAMMGLTFLIGFFVAAVIKIIANWADLLDFCHVHQQEIAGMMRPRLTQVGTAELVVLPATIEKPYGHVHQKLTHWISETFNHMKLHKRITA